VVTYLDGLGTGVRAVGLGIAVFDGLGTVVDGGLGTAVAVGPGPGVRLDVGVHAGGLGTALAVGPGTAVSEGAGTAVAVGLGSGEPDGDNTAEAIAGTAAAIRAADTPIAATRSFVRKETLLGDGGPGPHRPEPFASTHTQSLRQGCMRENKTPTAFISYLIHFAGVSGGSARSAGG